MRHRWTGWDDSGRLLFQTPAGESAVEARATVVALGGASWPRLGSDGGWVELLRGKGVGVSPLKPANCGFIVNWSDIFRERFEGGAVYAFSAELREAILRSGLATLHIALRPDIAPDDLIKRLSAPRGKLTLSNWLRKAAQLS